jgi:hypothetical protein
VRLFAVALCVVALAAGCGGTEADRDASPGVPAEPPPTLAAADLPELTARTRALTLDLLAADSFAPDELAGVLREAGYLAGHEREFTGRTTSFDRVLTRSLRFADAAGARAYLAWLRQHPDEFLGASLPEPGPAVGEDGFVFALERCGTCKKELPTYLAAWRRGDSVAFLLAAGRGANRDRFDTLAALLDERIRT